MCFLSVCCQTDVISRAGNHITSLGCPPTQCRCGPAVGAAQIVTAPGCSCPQCPQPSELARFPLWGRSAALCQFHRHRVRPVHRVGLTCSLQEGSGLLPWPHRPGFHSWFYFHLYRLLLRLPWRTWACPCEGQVWRRCSCLGHRGSGTTRYSGELRLGQQEI